jgi:hypothetical protein
VGHNKFHDNSRVNQKDDASNESLFVAVLQKVQQAKGGSVNGKVLFEASGDEECENEKVEFFLFVKIDVCKNPGDSKAIKEELACIKTTPG